MIIFVELHSIIVGVNDIDFFFPFIYSEALSLTPLGTLRKQQGQNRCEKLLLLLLMKFLGRLQRSSWECDSDFGSVSY